MQLIRYDRPRRWELVSGDKTLHLTTRQLLNNGTFVSVVQRQGMGKAFRPLNKPMGNRDWNRVLEQLLGSVVVRRPGPDCLNPVPQLGRTGARIGAR
jgi:hypothetical protein